MKKSKRDIFKEMSVGGGNPPPNASSVLNEADKINSEVAEELVKNMAEKIDKEILKTTGTSGNLKPKVAKSKRYIQVKEPLLKKAKIKIKKPFKKIVQEKKREINDKLSYLVILAKSYLHKIWRLFNIVMDGKFVTMIFAVVLMIFSVIYLVVGLMENDNEIWKVELSIGFLITILLAANHFSDK